MATLSKKSDDVIENFVKKPHNFVKKTMNYVKKTQMILRSYIQISQKKGDFKNKFLFNNGSIFETNDYFDNRSRGNVSFTELSEIITTL